jgi:hypothetical protein
MATTPEPKVTPATEPAVKPKTTPEVPEEAKRGIDSVPPGVNIPLTSEESPPVEHKKA